MSSLSRLNRASSFPTNAPRDRLTIVCSRLLWNVCRTLRSIELRGFLLGVSLYNVWGNCEIFFRSVEISCSLIINRSSVWYGTFMADVNIDRDFKEARHGRWLWMYYVSSLVIRIVSTHEILTRSCLIITFHTCTTIKIVTIWIMLSNNTCRNFHIGMLNNLGNILLKRIIVPVKIPDIDQVSRRYNFTFAQY